MNGQKKRKLHPHVCFFLITQVGKCEIFFLIMTRKKKWRGEDGEKVRATVGVPPTRMILCETNVCMMRCSISESREEHAECIVCAAHTAKCPLFEWQSSGVGHSSRRARDIRRDPTSRGAHNNYFWKPSNTSDQEGRAVIFHFLWKKTLINK